ncbi:ankyrin repeat-containing domain protein [Daldinia sp. FL1419]|nr:ankyrin repeat-containing domain protein [Daldinia sp. FL1419]
MFWLEYLLNSGANAAARDFTDHEATPIMTAAYNGIESAVDLLIRHGADVNEMDERRFTALHAACVHRKPEIVTDLIDNGAKVDATNVRGESPLHFILCTVTMKQCSNHLKTTEIILNFGADPMLEAKFAEKTETALEIAFNMPHEDVLELIISKCHPRLTTKQTWRLFVNLARAPKLPRLKLLLMLDTQNLILQSYHLLLKLLKGNGNTSKPALLLLSKGALCDGLSVFWTASYQKGTRLLRKTLLRGINPNVILKPDNQYPLLLEALRIDYVLQRRKYLKLLMEYGTDITKSVYSTRSMPIFIDIISHSYL